MYGMFAVSVATSQSPWDECALKVRNATGVLANDTCVYIPEFMRIVCASGTSISKPGILPESVAHTYDIPNKLGIVVTDEGIILNLCHDECKMVKSTSDTLPSDVSK